MGSWLMRRLYSHRSVLIVSSSLVETRFILAWMLLQLLLHPLYPHAYCLTSALTILVKLTKTLLLSSLPTLSLTNSKYDSNLCIYICSYKCTCMYSLGVILFVAWCTMQTLVVSAGTAGLLSALASSAGCLGVPPACC